jgi:hypothetical protein
MIYARFMDGGSGRNGFQPAKPTSGYKLLPAIIACTPIIPVQ